MFVVFIIFLLGGGGIVFWIGKIRGNKEVWGKCSNLMKKISVLEDKKRLRSLDIGDFPEILGKFQILNFRAKLRKF